ncbi:MAG: sulfatase-like hydrolase/transferase [Desulfobacterales bacterium]|nr:MAG: sulfatase-like hydrolase/transferase [Desulfobacterales bacterium]
MQASKPNIFFIITDQQRYDTISAQGFPYVDTPNLDRLIHEGVCFTNNFVTSASCGPSRASLFKGYYPHTTGIYRNAEPWQHSWIEYLADAGYYCVNIGKMHTFPYETPLGFHERFVVENKDRYLEGRFFFDRWDLALQANGYVKPQRELYRKRPDYRKRLGAFEWELPEKLHSDFYVGDLVTWWIRTKPKTEPLFLQVGFPGPHPPYDPIPRYLEPYMSRDLKIIETTQEELDALPPPQKACNIHNTEVDFDSIAWTLNPTKEQLHRVRAHYLANVTMIDEKVGQILTALEEEGYLENTVVIFTSDHGDCLGDHGRIQKWCMYDTITRTPLIVWGPKYFEGGQIIDDLVQQFDIAPVIHELAGAKSPDSWETKSLMPLLRGEKTDPHREYVFAEQRSDALNSGLTETEFMTMVRSKDWKLVHYLGNQSGELYDLKKDPNEQNNLWTLADYNAKKDELLRVLLNWRMRSDNNTADWPKPWR